MLNEIWKPVPIEGYEEFYFISSLGRVKSLRTNRVLKGCINKNGYKVYGLTSKNGEDKIFYAHRLVAMAFIPNPDNKPEVDHIIPISEGGTNEVSNLRWVTSYENTHNIITSHKNSEAKKGRVLDEGHVEILRKANTKDEVIGINIKDGHIITYASCEEARRNGYSHVSDCCRGKRNSDKSYKWYYKKEAIKLGIIKENDKDD